MTMIWETVGHVESTTEEVEIVPYSDFYFKPAFETTPDWIHIEPFQFCGSCGKELVDTGRVTGYDRYTGYKIITRYVECTQLKDYSESMIYFGGSSHDRWILTYKKDVPF